MKQYLGYFTLEYLISRCEITLQLNQKLFLQCDQCYFDEIQQSTNKIKYIIKPSSLKSYLQNEKGEDIIEIYHFYQEIWPFLINYEYVSLDIKVKDITQFHYIIQFNVYLLEKSFKDFDQTQKEQNNYDNKEKIKANQQQKVIHTYVKESFLILFEILNFEIKIRATLRPQKMFVMLNELLLKKYKSLPFHQRLYLQNNLLIPQSLNKNQTVITQQKIAQFQTLLMQDDDVEVEKNPQINQTNDGKDIFDVNEANSRQFSLCKQPNFLTTKLFPYQAQAIQWMLFREQKINAEELNFKNYNFNIHQTWSKVEMQDQNYIYYNEFTGQFSNEIICQKETQGGILADTMGLGKTICSLGLILLSKELKQEQMIQDDNGEDTITKKIKLENKKAATLLVVQLSIFDHWIQEIENHAAKNQIEWFDFYKPENRKKYIKLEIYDVVLTTYGILKEDYKRDQILQSYQWERIILDEAHTIKSKSTVCAKAAQSINANYRWCLSGTPIQNHLDDLFSLFHFLKIDTFSDYHWFNHYINKETNFKLKFDLLHKILEPILLRRTKESEGIQQSLNLPPKQQFVYLVKMNDKENEFYNKLYSNVYSYLKQYYGFNNLKKQRKSTFIHIFQLISNLRQCCDHPGLVMQKLRKKILQNKKSAVEKLQEYVQITDKNIQQALKSQIEELQKQQQRLQEQNEAIQQDEEDDEENDDQSISQDMSDHSTDDSDNFLQQEQNNGQQQRNQQQIENDLQNKITQLQRIQEKAQDPNHLQNTSKQLFDKMKEDSCPICILPLKDKQKLYLLPCKHFMCECFERLVRYDPQNINRQLDVFCPICRTQVERNTHIVFSLSTIQKDENYDWLKESSKINQIIKYIEYVKSQNEKVVIFTQWIQIMNFIQGKLRINNIDFRQIVGKMDKSKRKLSIQEFYQNPNITAMTISLKAGAYGINLSCANHVLLVDPWWNPAVEDQAIERVHRIGQKKPVKIISFICENTIEMRVLEMHKKKRQLFKDALQLTVPVQEFNFQQQLEFLLNEKFS